MRENNCLLIERGELCCGPITAAGCNARCPELRVPVRGLPRAGDATPTRRRLLAMFAEKGL